MQIAIIGTGYVGLTTGTCLADFGLSVTCVDQDETKVSLLNSGSVPIYEPNLAPLMEKNISAGRLTFTTDLEKAVKESKVIFITASTTRRIKEIINKYRPKSIIPIFLVSNPEFLREDSAVYGFTHPDKIVIECENDKAKQIMQEIYRKCFNLLAMENSRKVLPDLTYCQDEYEAAQGSHALVIAAEWKQFRNLNLLKIKKLLKFPILLDLRNLYESATLKSLGFIYEGVGRK